MTLDEAIKEQEDALADKWCPWSDKLKASIRLGIEALKAVKRRQWEFPNLPHLLLLGQTKE